MGYSSTTIPEDIVASLPPEIQAQVPLYDETLRPKIYGTLAVCTAIAYVSLVLRLYARRLTKQPLGLDDLFAGLTVLFTTVSVSLVIYLTSLGLGRHKIAVILMNIEDFDSLNQAIIASCSTFLPIIFCIKASALFLYCRLFPTRRFHLICYAILAFTALYALISILVLTISCLPPRPPTPEEPMAQPKCSSYYMINTMLVILITNVVLDAVILCLPLPLIWQLHTTMRRKLQLTLVFTFGSFIFIVSIIRVFAVKRLNPLKDFYWGSTDFQLWSIAESAVSILTVSLPVMQPALRRVIYREDGSFRFSSLRSKTTSRSDREKICHSSYKPSSLLTFGRSGLKGPKPEELDMLTIRTATSADSVSDSNVTQLALQDRDSYNMGVPWKKPEETRPI